MKVLERVGAKSEEEARCARVSLESRLFAVAGTTEKGEKKRARKVRTQGGPFLDEEGKKHLSLSLFCTLSLSFSLLPRQTHNKKNTPSLSSVLSLSLSLSAHCAQNRQNSLLFLCFFLIQFSSGQSMELKPPSRFPPNRHPGQPVQVPLKEWATVDEKEEEEEKEPPAPPPRAPAEAAAAPAAA